MLAPPLCSSCVGKYFFAKLWAVLENVGRRGKGELSKLVRETRTLYGMLGKRRAGDFGIPSLRDRRINRTAARWCAKNLPSNKKGSVKS